MENLFFQKKIKLTVNKENNTNLYTSKLFYNIRIIDLFLRTNTVWSDIHYSQCVKLLIHVLQKPSLKEVKMPKPQYLHQDQLEFNRDFQGGFSDTFRKNSLNLWYDTDSTVKPVFLNTRKFFSLFQTFITFNMSFASKKSPTHADYRLLCIITHGGEVKFVSVSRLHNRWVNMFHLLVNIFLYRTNLLIFGSPVFKEELIAINWSLGSFKFKFFKKATPYFFFKDSSYGSQFSSTFFNLIHDLGYKILFLTNVRDLDKTVHFLRTAGFYMIAPVPYNMSPWSVSFPVPVFINNLFTQLFFLKFITFAQQRAYSERFKLYNNYWLVNN